jgi:hypothetical protein
MLNAGTYYVVIAANEAFTFTLTKTAIPAPIVTYYNPYDNAVNQVNPMLEWGMEYAEEYQLLLGTAKDAMEVVVNWTTDLATSYQTVDLQNNTQYFWQVNAKGEGGETTGEVYSFVTLLNVPAEVTANATNLYPGESTTISWTEVEGASEYNIYVDGNKVANVTIPAVYATDNYDKFNEIKYTRSYRTSGGTVTTINTPFNEVATIPFETTGKHEIRYKAVDRAGNTLGEVVYDIVVYDDTEENKTKLKTDAKLDFVIGNKTVSDKDEVITFKKPVVNDSYDTSIEVLTYYQLKNDGTDVGELVKLTDEDINKDGKYEIKLKELLEEKNNSFNQVQVVVKAKFDEVIRDLRVLPLDDNSDLFTFNGHGYDIPVIDILNSKLDTQAPVVTTADWESKLFELNSSVISNTKSLKDASDEVIGGTIKSISADGWACTDEDGQVKLEESLDATTKVKVAPFDQGTNIITLPEVKFGEEYDANLKISVTITDNDRLGPITIEPLEDICTYP